MLKVTYKHWKSGAILEVVGEMPESCNNILSDRVVVLQPDGTHKDIIKKTIVRIEEYAPDE